MDEAARVAETEKRIAILNELLSKSEDGLEASVARAERAAAALGQPDLSTATTSTGSGCWATARTSAASSAADEGEWWCAGSGGSSRGRPPSPGRWPRRSSSADRLAQGLQRSSSAGLAARLSASGPRLSMTPRISRPIVRVSLNGSSAVSPPDELEGPPLRSPRFALPPEARPSAAEIAAACTPNAPRRSSSFGRGSTASGTGLHRVGGALPAAEATASPLTPRGTSGTSTPRGASASGTSTPRGSAARFSRPSSSGRVSQFGAGLPRRARLDTKATPEEVDATIREALQEVEPGVRLALELRLDELQAQVSSSKARVQELSQQNQLRRKRLDKQKWMEGQIRDKEIQNRLFEARHVESMESKDMFKDAEEDAVLLSRQVWERSRMCVEETVHMRLLVAEKKDQTEQYSQRCASSGDDAQAAKRLLVSLDRRIAELEKVRAEAEKKARENSVMLKRVIAARHPQRWS